MTTVTRDSIKDESKKPGMNWEQISENNTKAFFHFWKWLTKGTIELTDGEINEDISDRGESLVEMFKEDYLIAEEDSPWNWRNLYDFFDDNEIYVEIFTWKTETKFGFNYHIKLYNVLKHPYTLGGSGYENKHYIRSQAESAGFTKAFEMLERRLNE